MRQSDVRQIMFALPNSLHWLWTQLNFKSTTPDGLTLSPSVLFCVIIILSPLLTFHRSDIHPVFLHRSLLCLLSRFTSLIHEAIFGLRYLLSFQWQTICRCSANINIIMEPQSLHRWNGPHDVSGEITTLTVIFNYCHCKGLLRAKTLHMNYMTGTFYGL